MNQTRVVGEGDNATEAACVIGASAFGDPENPPCVRSRAEHEFLGNDRDTFLFKICVPHVSPLFLARRASC